MSRHKCPRCGSRDNATIMYGYLGWSEKLIRDLDLGRVAIGGCVISGFDPRWQCNKCGATFGLPGERAPNFTVVESQPDVNQI